MPFKVCVIGAGRGLAHVRAFQQHPHTEVVALCDADQARLEAARERTGVEVGLTSAEQALASDADIIVVATPPDSHASLSVAALQAGKHVLSEVPAALTLQECERLAQAQAEAKTWYMLAENCCYYTVVHHIKQLAEAGELGEIFYAEAEYLHDLPALAFDAAGRPTWRHGYPPSLYGTHTTGPAVYILGQRLVEVTAYATKSTAPYRAGNNLEVGIYKTSGGAVAKIIQCFALARPGLMYYSFWGTKGCYETRRGGEQDRQFLTSQRTERDGFEGITPQERRESPIKLTEGSHGGAEDFMIDDFVQALQADRRPPIDVREGLAYTAPGICACQSIVEGRTVAIPQFH